MTLEQYLAKYKDGYNHDGAYGEQCTDWFRGYCKFVLEINQPTGVTGAYQFWDNRNTDSVLKNNFTAITNTATAIPQYGDVIVWKKALNGNYGHVAICIDDDATINSFKSSDQNWDGKSNSNNESQTKPAIITHNYKYVAGWLRPNNQSKIKGETQASNGDNMKENELLKYLGVENETETKNKLKKHLGEKDNKCNWGSEGDEGGFLGSARKEITSLKSEITSKSETIKTLQDNAQKFIEKIIELVNPVLNYVDSTEEGALTAIRTLITTADNQNKEITKIKNEAEEKINSLNTENKTLKNQLALLQTQLDDTAKKHADELNVLQKKIDKIQSQLDSNNEEKDENSSLVSLLERIIKLFKK